MGTKEEAVSSSCNIALMPSSDVGVGGTVVVVGVGEMVVFGVTAGEADGMSTVGAQADNPMQKDVKIKIR